jgi:hypothetical protein
MCVWRRCPVWTGEARHKDHTARVMRIFIGIDLDPEVRARISRFLEGVQGFAPDARWVRPSRCTLR